jgi:hypothetical protein
MTGVAPGGLAGPDAVAIDLDPEVARSKKAARARRLHTSA